MRPLSGKRVIAWTVGVAGPYGGMVFAELGAEVILLERPGGKRPVGGILSHERNKKSIAINAREEDGKEIIDITETQVANFAGNMLQVKGNNDKRYLIMSQSAYDSLTTLQVKTLEKHAEILSSSLSIIEACGGGSARCMMAEVFLPKA